MSEPNRSGNEMKVETGVSEKTIRELEKMNGYSGVTVAGIEMGVTEKNIVEINDSNTGTSDTANSGKKTSKYITVGNSIIMKFREKIQDIVNGVTLKVKEDKDKDKESGAKKSDTKKQATQTAKEDQEEK